MSDNTCAICYDVSADYKTDCDHGFCNRCITNWLLMNNNCPLCRKEFYKISVFDVIDDMRWSGINEDNMNALDEFLYQMNIRPVMIFTIITKYLLITPKLPNNININYKRRHFRYDNNNFNNIETRY